MLTHLSLFSGIGGLDLAAEMAGILTVGQCEWADFQTKVLEKHWPDIPRWRDIKTLTGESFHERTGLRTVDIISGGFPCQPFSVAGKRNGKDDDRYLWDEMFRVIKEIQPTWVVGENVSGIINMALDTVLSDLESIGFETQPFLIPACGVDAPHRRYRVCILAYNPCKQDGFNRESEDASKISGQGNDFAGRTNTDDTRKRWEDKPGMGRMADGVFKSIHRTSSDTTICDGERYDKGKFCRRGAVQTSIGGTAGIHSAWDNWEDEPGLDRVVDGIPNRVDRLKSLGNAVVPQQFYIFFKLIADIENAE